ncbi:MAG: hypothetical protein AMXMBFR53_38690 [Gemmatimonadota bacterium]
MDFADIQMPWGRRYDLVLVLGYSRALCRRFSTRKDMGALLDGLEEILAFLGGVPEEILFDQMRSVITRAGRLSGERLVTNAEFERFAAHYGFKIRACRPYRAQTKGKVERPDLVCAQQLPLRPGLPQRRRPGGPVPALAREDRQRPDPPHHR